MSIVFAAYTKCFSDGGNRQKFSICTERSVKRKINLMKILSNTENDIFSKELRIGNHNLSQKADTNITSQSES